LLLFESTEDENRKRLSKLEGRLVIDGKPFTYRPDAKWRPNRQTYAEARLTFVSAVCEIYRSVGGHPFVPRDGRTNDFCAFLDAVARLLPSEVRTSLHSSARRALKLERTGEAIWKNAYGPLNVPTETSAS
jgi:hypothetical protein